MFIYYLVVEQAEIELMRKLNHPNIVKYVDTIRAEDFLYIILEYVPYIFVADACGYVLFEFVPQNR